MHGPDDSERAVPEIGPDRVEQVSELKNRLRRSNPGTRSVRYFLRLPLGIPGISPFAFFCMYSCIRFMPSCCLAASNST